MAQGLKEFVRDRLAELETGPFEAARDGGLQRNFINDILIGRKLSVRGVNIARLAKALRMATPELGRRIAEIGANELGGEVIPAPEVVLPKDMPADVPVRGTAHGAIVMAEGEGGEAVEGFVMEPARIVQHVRRPPALVGVPDAYAVYVVGNSMAPRDQAGELRFVHPHRPPRDGDTVLILTRPGEGRPVEAFIKTYRGRTRSGGVLAEQTDPRAVIEFPKAVVLEVHRVLTLNELFGV